MEKIPEKKRAKENLAKGASIFKTIKSMKLPNDLLKTLLCFAHMFDHIKIDCTNAHTIAS